MKNLVIYIFLLINTISQLMAQSPFSTVNSILINNKTYVCDNGRSKITIIYDQDNPSITWNPANEPPAPQGCREMSPWMRINKPLIKNAIYSVFNATRRAELYASDKYTSIQLYINPSTGELVDVYFYIRHASSITPTEVYQLDQALKGLMMPVCPECVAKSYIVRSYPIKWDE
jgi:hypothetical protein